MILGIDIGNSTYTMGIFEGKKMSHHFRQKLRKTITPAQLSKELTDTFKMHGIAKEMIHGVIIANVVPEVEETFVSVIKKTISKDILFVDHTLDSGITYCNDIPANLGADRICDMTAAAALFGTPCIVVDTGTATVFNVISEKNEYIGGAISPGIGISYGALIHAASLINKSELEPPKKVIGTNTETNIQSGIIVGHASMIDGMVEKIKQEVDYTINTVVATGGYISLLAPFCTTITNIEPLLTLEGLRLLWERNKVN